ncbi:MAG: hypothetical protein MUE84_18695, partial [Hyphomonas sp.]|nr:hypothetical protein [Hyphomonas sp.]
DAFGIDATGTIKNDLPKIGTRANAPLPKASNRYAIRDAMLYPISQKPFRGSMLIENGSRPGHAKRTCSMVTMLPVPCRAGGVGCACVSMTP